MTLGEGKVVCVTGGSGFIATWLVKLLLERGYTVKASVRDLKNPKKTEHLRALPGADERLHLFKADLLEEGSFDSIVAGCDGVFHTASPFFTEVKDPQAELIDPALKGTINVLASCAKTPSIKRVVITSSIAANSCNSRPVSPDTVIDETWYSDVEFCTKGKRWYNLSKTLAEEYAWKFAKEHGLDIVTINPAMVIGPILQPTLNTSVEAVLTLVNGAETYNNKSYGWVDVRDVANAHILAFEVPTASGRYLLVDKVAHYSDIVKILQNLYPDIKLPNKCADDKPFASTYQVSKERTQGLGIEFTPVEISFKDTVERLKELKLTNF